MTGGPITSGSITSGSINGSYGAAFSKWRGQCPDIWASYTRHPFVTGFGDGTLPRAAFLTYLQQDYVFLIHFSRAWALAVVKADNLVEMKMASAMVHALINEEMQLHISLCAAEGISTTALEATAELPQNLAYTRYVLEAGYSGDFLDLMAALAPCVFGYGEIGLNLQATKPSPTYKSWIDTYSGDAYQTLCHDLGAMIDKAVQNRLGADYNGLGRWQTLSKHFAMATALERDFWDVSRV